MVALSKVLSLYPFCDSAYKCLAQRTLGILKRCVTNVGASGLTNKKNNNYFNSTTSFSGSRTRSSSTDFVCVHTRISSYVFPDGGVAHGRTVSSKRYISVWSRTWCGPWPYRILKTSSRTSLRMNARACTPRAEFSDPESTALHSQKYRSSKFPDRQFIREIHTT